MSSFELDPFFLMREPTPNRCVADLDPDAPYESEKIICSAFPKRHARGRRISPLDVIVTCDPAPDVIYTWMSECLIQDRVRRIFEQERLTGFTTKPAKAKVIGTGVSLSVSELAVMGWGGMAPPASGIQEDYRCKACGHLHYSALRDPKALVERANWDGSDFFIVWPLPSYRFVTRRVVEVCRSHSISGISFQRHFSRPSKNVVPGYSPGRLSYYMPEERAHALGDSLAIF